MSRRTTKQRRAARRRHEERRDWRMLMAVFQVAHDDALRRAEVFALVRELLKPNPVLPL